MKWNIILVVIAMFWIVFALRAKAGLSVEAAREHLKKGALLVDVRTVGEFQSGHVTNAVNIPLDELKEKIAGREPDKSRVVLLYCRSGRRSGIAESELRKMGYTNALNMGSYGQAQDVVSGKAK